MQIAILTAPTKEHFRFMAKAGEPYGLIVEHKDRETAFNSLIELMRKRVPDAEFVRIDWPRYHPLIEICGSIDPNDPMQREYEEIIRENRRKEAEADGIFPELDKSPA